MAPLLFDGEYLRKTCLELGFLLALVVNSGRIATSLKEPFTLTDVRCSAYVRVAAQIT